MSKNKDADAAKGVLEYLIKQNRPYSAIDVFNNLHKAYGKTAVVKVLESLAQTGKVKEKTYGKQKVYVADQSQFPDVSDSELKQMDLGVSDLTQKLHQVQEENRKFDAEFRSLNSSMTSEEAQKQLSQVSAECSKLITRLESLKSNSDAVSPEERAKIMKAREVYVRSWRKRKRINNDITNAVLEGYPKSKKEFFEEVGIEPDEEYNVKPPEL